MEGREGGRREERKEGRKITPDIVWRKNGKEVRMESGTEEIN
jgi:hypothetical protein